MVGKNIGHGGFMIEIKNIVRTLSPERNPSTRLKPIICDILLFRRNLKTVETGDPAGYCVPVGKRSMQA